jgi:hypothetical protein
VRGLSYLQHPIGGHDLRVELGPLLIQGREAV